MLRERDPPKIFRIQYQVENETQIIKNQKIVEDNIRIEVKNYPIKKQQKVQQPK